MKRYYAGIGASLTPSYIQTLQRLLGFKLASEGWILRSGDAPAADRAYYEGALDWTHTQITVPEQWAEVWITYDGHRGRNISDDPTVFHAFQRTPNNIKAQDIARSIHPNWGKCTPIARLLHGRNIYQILGADLETPVVFVSCWAKPNGKSVAGGTRTAYELARQRGIPCLNLAEPKAFKRALDYLEITEERLMALAGIAVT